MYRIKNFFIMLVFTAILFTGCGENLFEGLSDSNSAMAKKEDAKIALDKGNYTEAVSLLEDLCGTDTSNLTCNEETQADLASAYVARSTGLDVLQLIAKAEEAAANPTDSFITVSTLLPIADINACAADPAASCPVKEDMENAIGILEGLLATTGPSDPNLTQVEKNLYLQLAVASAVNIAVNIGISSGGLDDTAGTPVGTPSSESDLPAGVLEDIERDVNNVADGIQGSGISADLTDDIATMESGLDADGNGDVTFSELQTYISVLQ